MATTRMTSRYFCPPMTGSQPASEFWLMTPILPAPFGTSQMMMKNAAS